MVVFHYAGRYLNAAAYFGALCRAVARHDGRAALLAGTILSVGGLAGAVTTIFGPLSAAQGLF